MAIPDTRALGRKAEDVALDHLRSEGLKLVRRNFRCRAGEIDLVMRDGQCLVFVEVRYRRPGRFASAAASIDEHKQRKLVSAASFYIARHPQDAGSAMRFDVIAIDGPAADESTLQWLRGAFRPR